MNEMIRMTIVTPNGQTCSEDVETVTLPGVDGSMLVYSENMPVVARMMAGEVFAKAAGHTDIFSVGAGFFQFVEDQLMIFTDMAVACA